MEETLTPRRSAPSPKILYFNYDWKLPDSLIARVIREFLDNGADHFVFTEPLLRRALETPDYLGELKHLEREFKIKFGAMHACYGGNMALNLPDPARRPEMLKAQIRSLQIASEFEVKTVTFHADAHHYVHLHCPLETLRPFFRESLEILLKHAEKYGVVIALENCFEKPNSAKEILAYAAPYAGNPHLGFCYDTGHANIMAPAPWKDMAMYHKKYDDPDFWSLADEWWEGIELEAGALEKMNDSVVTCHMHDNNGYNDLHGMPFDGTIDWSRLAEQLKNCPRMIEYQTEICFKYGVNWAGPLLAPRGGYSIRRLVETFRKLGF